MDNAISIDEWVRFLGKEYLESFIKDGGASVKFVVTPEELNDDLALALADQSQNLGYRFVEFDASTDRAHMPQDIFFAISRQINWRLLARRVIIELAKRQGYAVMDVDPSAAGNIYGAIGAANGLDNAAMFQSVRVVIQEEISKNRKMARDFRVAMSHLCVVENLVLDDDSYVGQPLIDWLTGANMRIGNVRHFSVHTPINRTTARHFMESAFYWIRYAGYTGVLLLLDNTRVTLARRPQDGSRYYTKAMVIDHYELLRELIDSTDRFSGTLVVVTTDVDFLDQDSRSRGFGAYQALMTRVMDDVRDRNLTNPMASLVRLC
jgi:hypothetical protein